MSVRVGYYTGARGGQRSFPGFDEVRSRRRNSEMVGCVRCGKVVHLDVEYNPYSFPTTFDPKLYFDKKLQMCLYLVNCATIYKKDFKTITGRLISIYVLTSKQIQTNLTQLKEIYLLKIYGT